MYALDPDDYPLLFKETQVEWGPLTVQFQMGAIPEHLISNVTICGHVGDDWVIIRLDSGWSETGGTLEPGESYNDAIRRELLEEAGAELVSDFRLFGGYRMVSSADGPYRPHLPYPVSYRAVGIGEIRIITHPTNPSDGEQVREVGSFPLDVACQLLEASHGPDIAALYR